jgi:sarcosine oxidase
MDVVVVGAGVMGLSAAWRLAQAGADVVVLEQFCAGHHHGSSHGPTRVFRTLYDDPVYVRMAQAAIPLWRELESASGADLLRMTGGVQVDDAAVLARSRAVLESCGERADLLPDGAPWLCASPALWVDNIGVIAADATVAALGDVARVPVIEDAEVVSIDAGVVRTRERSYPADVCVVAAGAWARPLLARAGIELPVRVTREQVLYFAADTSGMTPFVHGMGHWVYGVPSGDVMKVAEHHTGAETSAEDRTFDLDEAGAARVREYVAAHLPALDPEPVSFETCLYTTTPDEDFVLDRLDSIVVASPCSGHGFKFAPLIGEIVAAMVTGNQPPVDVSRFSLSRFGAPARSSRSP